VAAGRAAGVPPPPPQGGGESAESEAAVAAADAARSTSGTPIARARELRSLGNAAFTAGRMREADELYSAGIDALVPPPPPPEPEEAAGGGDCGPPLFPSVLPAASHESADDVPLDVAEAAGDDDEAAGLLCALLCNRAAVSLRRRRFAAARRDASAVLRAGRAHDETTLKALWRRGKAHEGRGDADAAAADFARVLELQPSNAEARETLEAYRSPLHRIVVMSYGDEDTRRRQIGGL